MIAWKKRLQRMLFLDELEPLVGQTPQVADFGSNSATAEREPHKWLAGTTDDKQAIKNPQSWRPAVSTSLSAPPRPASPTPRSLQATDSSDT